MACVADGYARTSGRLGVVIVTPGPGLGNMVSGCMESYGEDVSLLIIHVDTGRDRVGKGILHELVEPEKLFAHITKATFAVSRPDDIVDLLDTACRTAVSDRKGPVLISIPYVFFEKQVSWSESLVPEQETKKATPDLSNVEKTLRDAERPVIVAGRSLMFGEAAPIIEEICGHSSIPFLTTTSGKGIVREDRPYAFGNILQKGVVREIIASSDLVVAVGTGLREVDVGRRGLGMKKLVHIDVDNKWIGKNYPTTAAITGDLLHALSELREILQKHEFRWNLERLKEAKQTQEAGIRRKESGFRMIELLRTLIPEETVIVCDLNYPSYWAEYYFPVYYQNSFLMPRGVSPICYGLPAAIGAKIGNPNRPCIALCGDGGVLPVIGELATLKHYNIPLVVFVYNNNSYGILEESMQARYTIKGAMGLTNPDFVKIARAFDIKAKRTQTLDGLRKIFLRDVTWDEPFLIEFRQPVYPPPWRV